MHFLSNQTRTQTKMNIITCFGHADSAINNGESIVGLIRNEPDEELRLSIKLALVSEALKSDFIQSLHKSKSKHNQSQNPNPNHHNTNKSKPSDQRISKFKYQFSR